MKTLARTITGACIAATIVVPTVGTATAAPVRAHAKHYTVVMKIEGAKLGACKVAIKHNTAWRVYGRLDTHEVHTGKHSGTLIVVNTGKNKVVATWRTSLIKPDRYSKVGSVVLPKKSGYELDAGIGAEQMGNGGVVKIGQIRHC